MSLHFSANQFETNYKPSHLGSWTVPKTFRERPHARRGITKPLADNAGHLLPTVRKDNSNIWDAVDIFNDNRKSTTAKKSKTKTKLSGNQQGNLVIEGSSVRRHARDQSPREIVPRETDGNHKHENGNHSDAAYETDEEQQNISPFPLTRRYEAFLNARKNYSHRPLPRDDIDYSVLWDDSLQDDPGVVVTEKDKNHGYLTALTKRRVRKPEPEELKRMVVTKPQPRQLGEIDLAIQWDLLPALKEHGPTRLSPNKQLESTLIDHQKELTAAHQSRSRPQTSLIPQDQSIVDSRTLLKHTEQSRPASFLVPTNGGGSHVSPQGQCIDASLLSVPASSRLSIQSAPQERIPRPVSSYLNEYPPQKKDPEMNGRVQSRSACAPRLLMTSPSQHEDEIIHGKEHIGNNAEPIEYEPSEYPPQKKEASRPVCSHTRTLANRNISSINTEIFEYPMQKRDVEPIYYGEEKAVNDATHIDTADCPQDDTDNDSGLGRDISLEEKEELQAETLHDCQKSPSRSRREIHHTKRNCVACLAKSKDQRKLSELCEKIQERSPSRPRKHPVFVDEFHKNDTDYSVKFHKSKPAIVYDVIPGTRFGPKAFQDHKRLISTNQLAYKPFCARKHRRVESILVKQDKKMWK